MRDNCGLKCFWRVSIMFFYENIHRDITTLSKSYIQLVAMQTSVLEIPSKMTITRSTPFWLSPPGLFNQYFSSLDDMLDADKAHRLKRAWSLPPLGVGLVRKQMCKQEVGLYQSTPEPAWWGPWRKWHLQDWVGESKGIAEKRRIRA